MATDPTVAKERQRLIFVLVVIAMLSGLLAWGVITEPTWSAAFKAAITVAAPTPGAAPP
jgi:hypothetical protein